MHQTVGSGRAHSDNDLEGRVEALAVWLEEITERVQAAELANGDEKTAKELRKAIEALAKHDPKLEERLTNRVDVVAERLATMATTVSTTAAALARKDGEIANLRRELEAEDAKIQALVNELRRYGSGAGAPAIDDLRKSVATLEARERHRRGNDTADGLAGKVEAIAQRLDMFSTTLQTTAAGLAGREGELAALRRKHEDDLESVVGALAEIRGQIDPTPVSDLMEAVKAVAHETSAVKRSGQRAFDAVGAKVETLRGRVDSVSQAAGTTSAALASHETALASLRADFDSENTRVDGLVLQLHRALEALSSRTAVLDGFAEREAVEELRRDVQDLAGRAESLGATVQAAAEAGDEKEHELETLGRRLDAVEQSRAEVDRLASRLDSLATTVAATAATGDEKERELETLGRRLEAVEHLGTDFERLSGRLDSLGATVQAAAEAGDDKGHELEVMGRRLDAVEQSRAEVEHLAGRLESLGATVRAAAEANNDKGHELEVMGRRLDAVEQSRAEVEHLAGRLDSLGATVQAAAKAGDEKEHELEALGRRLDAVEQSRAEVDRLASRLDSLATTVAAAAATGAEKELELEALGRRFHAGCSRVDSLVGELRAALETMPEPAPDRELRSRVDELEEQVRGQARELAQDKAADGLEPSASARIDEVLRLLAALGERLDEEERDRASVAADLAQATDLWSTNLGALESKLHEVATIAGGQPGNPFLAAGEGRLRLETRALELRLENAEALARDNREAVLLQLERLASHVEWRLQRLEEDREAVQDAVPTISPPQSTGTGAQVVPLRGNEV